MNTLWKFYDANKKNYVSLSDEELKTLHSLLTEMTEDIMAFCRDRNLTIFLGGGSMLGAVRNKGIIPWDDDVDLNMPRKDYEILKKEFPGYMSDKYELTAPGTACPGSFAFAKIKRKGTVLLEVIGDVDHPEVFIDIFPIDYAPASSFMRHLEAPFYELIRNIQYIVFMRKSWKTSIKPGLKNCDFSTRFTMRLGNILGAICSIIPLEKWNAFFDRAVQKKPSPYATVPTGDQGYLGECWPSSDWLDAVDVEFEGMTVSTSAGYDRMMQRHYGNYMTPPPPEKRGRHYFLEIDLNVKTSP